MQQYRQFRSFLLWLSLLCKLHWLPIGFWVRFKMLVATYKDFHSIQPGYLWGYFSPLISAFPTRSSRKSMLHILSIKQCHSGILPFWRQCLPYGIGSLQRLGWPQPYYPFIRHERSGCSLRRLGHVARGALLVNVG